MISKEEALGLIRRTTKYSHALLTSLMMRRLAEMFGEDEERWEIVGLLHDLDYDQVKDEDMTKHGIVAAEALKRKLTEDQLYAIRSHDYRSGFKPKSCLDKALIISDSLAVLIEEVKAQNLEDIETAITRISAKRTWLRKNLGMCDEIGINIDQLLKISRETLNLYFGNRYLALLLGERGFVSSVLIRNEAGRILVFESLDGFAALPGGSSEFGETPEGTAIRESLEETGLRINIERAVAFYNLIVFNKDGTEKCTFSHYLFLASTTDTNPQPNAEWKNSKVECRRITLSDLRHYKNVWPPTEVVRNKVSEGNLDLGEMGELEYHMQ